MKSWSLVKSEIIRFGIVGILAVLVQYGVYYLCLFLTIHTVAFAIGYVISFIFNYIMTTTYTFHANKNAGNGLGFTFCHIINFLLQMGFLNLFISFGVDKQIAPIPVFAICVPINFFMVRFVMKKL